MATEVLVPPLGTNVDAVSLVEWYHAEGDTVTSGAPLFAVLTDKATLDVESPATGVLRGVCAAVGSDVPALSRIAWVCAEGEDPPSVAGASADPPSAKPVSAPAPAGPPVPEVSRRAASPWARTLAARHGIDLSAVEGTGPGRAVIGRDVEAAVGGLVEWVDLTGTRGAIAERMMQGARQTAAVTLTAEVDATPLVALRQAVQRAGLAVTYNDLLLVIVARALGRFPRMAAVFDGTRAVVRRGVHIALAVDTDDGLLAPVLRDVDRLALAQVAAGTARLVARARSGDLTPGELRGSVFTITNLGMFGIDAFTPIVNAPETAVLGVGRIRAVPWVGPTGSIGVGQGAWLSLTYDQRIVDGAPAARFLRAIVRDIEAPNEEALE